MPVLPVIYQVKKKITGISFALGGGAGQLFSPNPRSVVGFCREKNSKNWPGRQELWSLGSDFDMLYFLTIFFFNLRDYRYPSVLPSKTPKKNMKKVKHSPRT
jgi:hypothetical protein